MPRLSRRSLLKGLALTAASAPLIRLQRVVDDWYAREHGGQYSPGVLRLNSNENPYGPPPAARAAVTEAVGQGNLYPWGMTGKLAEKIADYEGLDKEQILITAGSSEVLGLIGLVAGKDGGKVVGCHPTFAATLLFAEKLGAHWVRVPLTADYQYNLKDLNKAIDADTRLVYVCNPNNPTGRMLSPGVLHPFCKTVSERSMVFVDEAYIEFTPEGIKGSLAAATATHPNLIVSRTFSKVYGMAGLRVGYAIAHPETIQAIRPFLQGRGMTSSVCSLAAAMASVGDEVFIERYLKLNQESLSVVTESFDRWEVEYVPSVTNFLMFRLERFEGQCVRQLRDRNVLIRKYGHLPGWARVSMGTPEAMQVFVNEIGQLRV
jgi:histidinol-phosphate aminotransferase